MLRLAFALEVAAPGWARAEREGRLPESLISVLAAGWLVLETGYELIEWDASSIFESEAGLGVAGHPGDPWDAQENMALALAGCCGVIVTRWISNRRPDLSQET